MAGSGVGASVDVLHVVPAYHPSRGGIEVLVEDLIVALDERFGLTAAVAAPAMPGHPPGVGEHRGTPVFRIADAPAIDTCSVPPQTRSHRQLEPFHLLKDLHSASRRLMQDLSPRLVHMHGTSLLQPAAASVATSMSIPVLFHVHGTISDTESPQQRARLRDARWLCAVSEAVRTSVERDCGRQAPIRLVRNGVGDPRSTTRPSRPHSPSVAMIGRLSPEKGFSEGLCALRDVHSRMPELKVRIVGAGPEQERLHSLVASLGMLNAVEYFGELDHADALRVLAGSDVVLVPSTCIEGFSLVAVEAALLERPVVATFVGGLPETVLDGVAGVIVEQGDLKAMANAIQMLLTNSDLRRDLGRAARERALEEFTVGRCATDIAELYSDIWTSADIRS